jgi:hypothetical protein
MRPFQIMMKVLNRNAERVFNPDRKTRVGASGSLKRDE